MSDGKLHVVRLTREELYEQVWTTPMRLLAKSYGISDVGLAKVCKRHKIPRPSLGYWAKKQVGKAPRRPRLPVVHDSMLENVEFMACPGRDASQDRQFFDPQIAELIATEAGKQIVVAEHLRAPHRFTAATRAWYERKREQRGVREPEHQERTARDWSEILDFDVTEDTLGRALRIINALVKAFESRGYMVRPQNTEWKRRTVVDILGQEFRFRIRERLRVVDLHPPAMDEAKNRKRTMVPTHFLTRNFVRSGLLELNVFEGRRDSYPFRSWRDTDKGRLEERLGGVIPAILTCIDTRKAEQATAETDARERAAIEQRKREAEQQRQREREKARVDGLVRDAESWHKSQSIREYIRAVRLTAEEQYGLIDPDGEIGCWLAWAEHVAAGFDPLTGDHRGHGDAPVAVG